MTKEEITQQLLRAVPGAPVLPDVMHPLGPAGIYRAAATEAVRPDSGEKDVPAGAGRSPLADELAILTREISELRRTAQNQVHSIESNTQATLASSFARAVAGAASDTIASNATSFIGRGTLLSPIVSGLIGLFRRESKEEIEPVRTYIPPSPVSIEAGVDRTGAVQSVSYGAYDLPRAARPSAGASLPPITIQVQAMDSRSFADHSHEIAAAVREALLSGHGLNDALGEL